MIPDLQRSRMCTHRRFGAWSWWEMAFEARQQEGPAGVRCGVCLFVNDTMVLNYYDCSLKLSCNAHTVCCAVVDNASRRLPYKRVWIRGEINPVQGINYSTQPPVPSRPQKRPAGRLIATHTPRSAPIDPCIHHLQPIPPQPPHLPRLQLQRPPHLDPVLPLRGPPIRLIPCNLLLQRVLEHVRVEQGRCLAAETQQA